MWLYAIDGWSQWPGRAELTSAVPVAEVAFRPAPSCAAGGCTLTIAGSGPADLRAEVDGVPVPLTGDMTGSLQVPITGAQAAGDVWVTLTHSSGESSELTMTGLSLTPNTTKGST